jgi:hypothetical protein
MDLVEKEMGGVEWIGLAQDRDKLREPCECGNKPSISIKCWESIKWLQIWWPLD